jgi:hypothetical protein
VAMRREAARVSGAKDVRVRNPGRGSRWDNLLTPPRGARGIARPSGPAATAHDSRRASPEPQPRPQPTGALRPARREPSPMDWSGASSGEDDECSSKVLLVGQPPKSPSSRLLAEPPMEGVGALASEDPGRPQAAGRGAVTPRPTPHSGSTALTPTLGGCKRRAVGSPPEVERSADDPRGDLGLKQPASAVGVPPARWSGKRSHFLCPMDQCGFVAQRQSGLSRHLCTVHSGRVLSADEAKALQTLGRRYCRTEFCGNLRHGRQCPWCHATDPARPIVRGDCIRAIPAYRPKGEDCPVPHRPTEGEEGRRHLGRTLQWVGTVAADDGEEITEEGEVRGDNVVGQGTGAVGTFRAAGGANNPPAGWEETSTSRVGSNGRSGDATTAPPAMQPQAASQGESGGGGMGGCVRSRCRLSAWRGCVPWRHAPSCISRGSFGAGTRPSQHGASPAC